MILRRILARRKKLIFENLGQNTQCTNACADTSSWTMPASWIHRVRLDRSGGKDRMDRHLDPWVSEKRDKNRAEVACAIDEIESLFVIV